MINRIFFTLITIISLCVAIHAEGGMVRVIDVADGQTIIVDRGGVALHVRLAGIDVIDAEGARTMMKWSLRSTWVLLEKQPDGGHFIYRSPDAMFINRELVSRGFARATLQAIVPESHVVVTYLGTASFPATRSPTVTGIGSAKTSPSRTRPSPQRRRRKP
jgi:hypothetical protein